MRSAIYFATQLWINISRNFLMSAAAMSTSVISLLTLGIFLIMVYNINKLSNEMVSQIEIRAFMKKDIPNLNVANLIENIRRIPQVRNIEYVPPDRALKKLEKDLKLDLTMSAADNPLPPALIIRVHDARHIRQVADQVARMQGVEDLKYGETVLQRVLAVSIAIKFIGFILTILMGIGTLFTIINTIRLTVIARHREIRTMQLVGATSWFIRWPFLLEGIFFGMGGAILSAAILSGGYYFFSSRLLAALPFLLPIVDEAVMVKALFVLLCLCGVLMGIAGSYISVTRFLGEEA